MSLDPRELEILDKSIIEADNLLYKTYLSNLTTDRNYLVTVDNKLQSYNKNHENIYFRLHKVERFVFDEEENNIDKLTSVFTSVQNLQGKIVYLINSDGKNVDFYVGVRSEVAETFANSLIGNFPGIELKNLFNDEIAEIVNNIDENSFISSAVVVPREKNEDSQVTLQGIEKFIDSLVGESYTAIFIADSFQKNQLKEIRYNLEDLYTELSVYRETNLTFGENEALAISKSLANGISDTVSRTISNTNSTTETNGTSKGTNVGTNRGTSRYISIGASRMISAGVGRGSSEGSSYGTSEGTNKSQGRTTGKTKSNGEQHSKNYTETNGESNTEGSSRSISVKREHKNIINLLNRIDGLLERLEHGEDIGIFNFGAYFLSNSENVANRAASTYIGLVKGKNSGLENSFVNRWNREDREFGGIIKYLKRFEHPVFEKQSNPVTITTATMVNSKELAIGTGFPYKSVPGVAVMQSVPFARNVNTYDKGDSNKIQLGNIYHMGQMESSAVELDVDSLTMHTFITGSTGSGKSNTTFELLKKVYNKGIKFLVVEPAKGEYKDRFGGLDNVSVYGTNPLFGDILRINPFSFPKNIHVLEHIDRLIEIFNACWPMYAAMPAILKDAIEKSYQEVGWDLDYSVNKTEKRVFPTFNTLKKVLPELIHNSQYSEEVKGNYIGALVTRIHSLTNGLLGRIFTENEISDENLFDQCVIVDLSRVGSVETKSLLMGIVFLKLLEYRIDRNEFTTKLNHLTILEEAHNLLRNSASSSTEGNNLQEKAVEMISNSIAEMRAYGEGFVIVDQAPGLLDQSAIRNTNTKIILRLPDASDRKLVGRAAMLNDKQINEVGRLKTGVAAIYQNNWLDTVLCAVNKFNENYPLSTKNNINDYGEEISIKKSIIELLVRCRDNEGKQLDLPKRDIEKLMLWCEKNITNKDVRDILIDDLEKIEYGIKPKTSKKENINDFSMVIFELINGNMMDNFINKSNDLDEYNTMLKNELITLYKFEVENINTIIEGYLYHQANDNEENRNLFFNWMTYTREGQLI